MQIGEMKIPDVGSADLSTEQKLQAVYEYMIQLNRQIRFVLENLGEENLSGELKEKIAEYDVGLKIIQETVKQDQFATYRVQTNKKLETKAEAKLVEQLNDELANKADQELVTELATIVTQTAEKIESKAEKTVVEQISIDLGGKADKEAVTDLAEGVEQITSDLAGKADQDTVAELATLVTQTAEKIESKAEKTVTDALGESISNLQTTVTQTADGLTAVVTGETAVGRVDTTAVVVNQTGVSVKTGGTFTVDSGNFSLDSEGNLTANGAQINGTLLHEGEVVLTGADIYVGTEEPSSKRTGMVWIRPITYGDENDVVQTTHTGAYTDGVRKTLRTHPVETILQGTPASTASTNCSYEVTVPVFFGGNVGSATLTVELTTGAGSITLSTTVSGNHYNQKTVRLTGSGSQWIANTGTIYCTISASTDNILSERKDSGFIIKLISRAN